MTRSELLVATPHGEGRLVTDRARRPIATLLLGHGAGVGIDTHDLEALAQALPRNDVTVVRFEQPWVRAGRKVATAPPTLDAALVAGADRLRTRSPLIVGGRSAGARSATRVAKRLGAVGCLALAFPLHPPGSARASRLDELLGARVRTLVIQGERDTMGTPEEFPARGRAGAGARCRPQLQGAGPRADLPGRRPRPRRRVDPGVDRARGRGECLPGAEAFLPA